MPLGAAERVPSRAVKPRVSVIVPTYNRARLLRRALASVYAQTRAPDEVLVVDDGSTDGTEALVREWYPQARYLAQSNRGVSAARNHGVQAANGNWLAFLDSDDEWVADKLRHQLMAIAASPEHRICHTDEIWMRRGRRVNPRRRHEKAGGWIFERCLPICAMSPSSVLLHRSVLDDVGLFDESMPACEDYDLWLRTCSRYPVLFLREYLVIKHGGRPDQLSNTEPGLDRYRIRALEKILVEGDLDESQRQAVLRTLVEKARIWAAGARKRGRRSEAEQYEALADRRGAIWPSSR